MATSRRNFVFFLGIGGATIASLTAAGFLYRAADRGSFSDLQSGKPFVPWREWENRSLAGAEAVALAGTLACSSLNSQPWWLRLEGNIIDLYFRRTSYPVFLDPFDREALIGLGACIENMVTGAEGLDRSATVTLFPSQTNIDHIARLVLGPGVPNETARFLAIGNRHTNRSPYDRNRPLSQSAMAALTRLTPSGRARFSLFPADSPKGQEFADAIVAATEDTLADPSMLAEEFQWFRQTIDQISATSNGLSFLTSGLSDLQVRTAMALPDISEEDFGRFWTHQTREVQLPNTPMFGILAVDDNGDPIQLVEAGRLLQRLHLEATAHGVAMQALGHVNWVADREEARGRNRDFIDRAYALSGGMGQMVLGMRLGYALRPARASPRMPLPAVLVPRMGPRPTPRPATDNMPLPRLREPAVRPPKP
ncbi:MAG TPA: hypothetical protein VIG90_01415 [Pedomonas sp.]|uniref:hypothetical protein n=1 Tax=Pedomonas sp. TaxID=2976421 RepID=UPI002F3F3A87